MSCSRHSKKGKTQYGNFIPDGWPVYSNVIVLDININDQVHSRCVKGGKTADSTGHVRKRAVSQSSSYGPDSNLFAHFSQTSCIISSVVTYNNIRWCWLLMQLTLIVAGCWFRQIRTRLWFKLQLVRLTNRHR